MFTRLLIANRGEIAVRIIRACRELGIAPIAVFSDADRRALHVQLADAAYRLGPAPAAESYLNQDAILAAAAASGAEAIHPGYGFLSENASFAAACAAAGLAFVGPPAEAIRLMGDKAAAKRLLRRAGVPVVPGYDAEDQSDERLAAAAEQIGYPILIKAAAGGGGKGMRAVERHEEFPEQLAGARREARSAFGDERVLLERLLQRPRHIEIQVLAGPDGRAISLGERECSVQRRHQKVIEEAPSIAVDPDLRFRLGEYAVRAAEAIGYRNAGTVEFMLDEDGSVYFLEMNTRLQVEHAVTEAVLGIDLVHLQLQIASGQPLHTAERLTPRGHAIECRVYAEDPSAGYLPSTGRIALFRPPAGPGIRNDVGSYTGDEVSPYYDPMLAKLIVYAADRPAAIERMRRALAEYAVLGVRTNLTLLQSVVESATFRRGAIDTGYLDRELAAPPGDGLPPPETYLAATALLLMQPASNGGPWTALAGWRQGGQSRTERWQVANVEGGGEVAVEVDRVAGSDNTWRLRCQGVAFEGQVELGAPGSILLRSRNAVSRIDVVREGRAVLVGLSGHAWRLQPPAPPSLQRTVAGAAGGRGLTAPMPGIVVKVSVREGERVEAHQLLLILEAMKMEHAIEAPSAGVVRRIHFAPGELVPAGATLIDLDAG